MDWETILSAVQDGDTAEAERLLNQTMDTEVGGLKNKVSELLGKLRRRKDEVLELSQNVETLTERLESMEDARTIEAEGQDSEAVQKLADQIAEKRYAKLREAFEGEQEDVRQKLADSESSRDAIQSKYRDMLKRQALLGRARALGLNEDLEDEFLGRLAPFLAVEADETGSDRMIARDGETIIPGSGPQDSATADELVEMLYHSKGRQPYNSRGKAFFMVNPSPAPDVPAGEVTERDIASMSQVEFEAWREKGTN